MPKSAQPGTSHSLALRALRHFAPSGTSRLPAPSQTYSRDGNGPRSRARLGISVHTYHNHLKAAFRTLHDSMDGVLDISADMDRSRWYDAIEELSERYAAAYLRRVSRKKENRSIAGGDRSRFEHDPSKSRRDANKNARARDESVAVTTKS